MENRSTDESFIDLEIHIEARREDHYPVHITLGDGRVFQGTLSASITKWIDHDDAAEDGQWLFTTLFADPKLRRAWDVACGASQQRRIRLWIDPGDAELHRLPWEALWGDNTMLSANGSTPFSRYLPVDKPWGGVVEERPIRVLAVISNPDDLDEYPDLPEIDVEKERTILEGAFSELDKREIQLDFLDAPVTMERLEVALHKGYHILHFVGHGMFNDKQQAVLYLQDEQGNTHPVGDQALVSMLSHQRVQPRLVFLAACQSAKRSMADAFLGLGPKLVVAGVPAVVAMQESVTVATARKLSQVFYQRLGERGIVDCAMNEARSVLLTAGRFDAAVPVLFMRLKGGAIWGSETEDTREREVRILTQMVKVYRDHLNAQVNIAIETASPYRGLLAYRLQDWHNFFGRSTAIEEMLARISGQGAISHLIILHAGSGTGKTSLIQAGLMPRLLAEGCLPFYIRGHDENPITVFKRDLLENLRQTPGLGVMPLRDFLQHTVETLEENTTLVIFFDQFEEFFTRGLSQEARAKFVVELGDCLKDDSLPVRFILSLRDEYFGQISTFAPRIQHPCENEYLMLPLTHAEAREAILKPVERLGLSYEDELVDMLLNDPEWETVAPPQLQVVCKALYEGLKPGERTISRALYTDLGGISGILQGYLERVLKQKLPREHRQAAKHVLSALVTPDWQRDRQEREALADWLTRAGMDTTLLDTVLNELIDNRLIRKVNAGELAEREAYELVHDYLIERLKPWIDDDQIAARRIYDMLAQGRAQHQQYGLLLDADHITIVEAQLCNPYLNLEADDLRFLLISAVDQGTDVLPWVEMADAPALDWIRELQHDASQPEPLRLAAAGTLGRLEDEEAFASLRDAPLTTSGPEQVHTIRALAHFLHGSQQHRSYPRSLRLSVERELATLQVRDERKSIAGLRRMTGISGALGAAITASGQIAKLFEGQDPFVALVLTLIVLLLFSTATFLLGWLLGYVLAWTRAVLGRRPLAVQVVALTFVGGLVGFPTLLPVTFGPYGWAAGAVIGAALAWAGRPVRRPAWSAKWLLPAASAMLTVVAYIAALTCCDNQLEAGDIPGSLAVGLFAMLSIRASIDSDMAKAALGTKAT